MLNRANTWRLVCISLRTSNFWFVTLERRNSDLVGYIVSRPPKLIAFLNWITCQCLLNLSAWILIKHFADCMSFSHKCKTLRSGNNYGLQGRPQLSAQEGDTIVKVKTVATKRNHDANARFFPDKIEESIEANLEPLHALISALTRMMERSIQGNSAIDFTTSSTH